MLRRFDEQRETVIKQSRDIQKAAKHAIFSLHRNAFAEADSRIASAMKVVEELEPLVRASPALRGGAFSGALEELAEAVVFRGYLVEKRLLPSSALPMAEVEEYLGGVLDFTGELNRYAILRATERDREAVQRAHDVVEAIFSAYIQFELRNGNLRKKYDALKYTLLKLENTLYELSLTEAGGMASRKAGGGGREERPEGGDM
ncbi:Translin family protein [Helicosporidium sp. ATCC 50920]|nr:Translin family protein [Helicosporidium sp. ATCC 50920]|eukprot:KDD75342.1 Translin family protein [Helicosporidium sp. ATCC 50920]